MTDPSPHQTDRPKGATGALVLEDGTVFYGQGLGRVGESLGEVVFNTAMTGYQEILTDPSYAGQIVTFTFPHIGNVGVNSEDSETAGLSSLAVRGAIFRMSTTGPSNWRAARALSDWLDSNGITALCGIDTRKLTRTLRDKGAQKGVIAHHPEGGFDIDALQKQARDWQGLEGLDLALDVTRSQSAKWNETLWKLGSGHGSRPDAGVKGHVVAIDYGIKTNILRSLAEQGLEVTVVPAESSAEDILAHNPDGIFLSNGPGDPAATGSYAVPTIRTLIDTGLPMFGICLGHQMLGLALGGKTMKMHHGHHGANHPVQDTRNGAVAITSQNHGFAIDADSLPDTVEQTHISLFDKTNQGIQVKNKPVFSVQFHPEASPGPHDGSHLFALFSEMISQNKKTRKSVAEN